MSRAVQQLADGFYFGECPRWHDGRLWFSDFFGLAVLSVSEVGDLREECRLDDRPGGLGWMPDGDLLIVSMTRRQVLRRHVDGSLTLHADLGGLASFHCNDMIVDGYGRAYVGNFGFDLEAALAERGVAQVLADHPTASLALIDPDGAVRVAAEAMHFPNGGAISPDGRTLIVAETLAGCLTAFTIGSDGALGDRRVWASSLPRVADGIALDAKGRVWCANPLAPECYLVDADGAVIDSVTTEEPCFACALGGRDGRTLFMLTAPASGSRVAGAAPRGRLLTTKVDVDGA